MGGKQNNEIQGVVQYVGVGELYLYWVMHLNFNLSTEFLLFFFLIQQVLVTLWNGPDVMEIPHASALFNFLMSTSNRLIVQNVRVFFDILTKMLLKLFFKSLNWFPYLTGLPVWF